MVECNPLEMQWVSHEEFRELPAALSVTTEKSLTVRSLALLCSLKRQCSCMSVVTEAWSDVTM